MRANLVCYNSPMKKRTHSDKGKNTDRKKNGGSPGDEKFRAIAETANDAIIMADSDGKIIFWNRSATRIFGYSQSEILGRPLTLLMPRNLQDLHQEGLKKTRERESTVTGRVSEMTGVRKDGSSFPIELSVSMWKSGDETFFSGIIRDITKRKSLEAALEKMATTDSLTGTLNRSKFQETALTELQRAVRYSHPLSLLMFDIDHFKKVNDTFGHLAGDEVLRKISSIVSRNLRGTDSLARWGGEEFVVIAPETDIVDAGILAERIRKEVADETFEGPRQVTVSFGIAAYREKETLDDIIRRADEALYRAKAAGRNRVEAA
jgi:diguanylate cyclase